MFQLSVDLRSRTLPVCCCMLLRTAARSFCFLRLTRGFASCGESSEVIESILGLLCRHKVVFLHHVGDFLAVHNTSTLLSSRVFGIFYFSCAHLLFQSVLDYFWKKQLHLIDSVFFFNFIVVFYTCMATSLRNILTDNSSSINPEPHVNSFVHELMNKSLGNLGNVC